MSKRVTKSKHPIILRLRTFAAISTLDGRQITEEMMRDFAEYDRLQLSPGERRKAILAKYAKKH